jgi:hypothetical protein
MPGAPKAVICINFLPTIILFDARPIWAAVIRAAREGRLPPDAMERISGPWGNTAIHLATRDAIMRRAVRELKEGMQSLCDLIPDTLSLDRLRDLPPLGGDAAEAARDRVLLAIDSFLYEFRAFLELLAKFCYGVLTELGKQPASLRQLSSGESVILTDKRGNLRPNDFLRYLCDNLQIPVLWYEFLSRHRNFFTHEATPYCAIEHRLVFPGEYDLLIMRTNIIDFSKAPPEDYFRFSECSAVLDGVRGLAGTTQHYLITTIDALS